LICERDVGVRVTAQVDDRESINTERRQVLDYRAAELLGSLCGQPSAAVTPSGADLGDQDEVLPVGVQSLVDKCAVSM
jgi:hypothetical protein